MPIFLGTITKLLSKIFNLTQYFIWVFGCAGHSGCYERDFFYIPTITILVAFGGLSMKWQPKSSFPRAFADRVASLKSSFPKAFADGVASLKSSFPRAFADGVASLLSSGQLPTITRTKTTHPFLDPRLKLTSCIRLRVCFDC